MNEQRTIILDGIVWELPYWDLLPALSAPLFDELKEDIRDKGGNIYPVLWNYEGGCQSRPPRIKPRRVIDGGHRLRAVAELRAEGWTGELFEAQLSTTADEEQQVALDLNIKRRQLTREEIAAAIVRLRQTEELSIRQISERVGVGVGTVHRALAGVPTGTPQPVSVTGKDGKTYSATRPTSSPAGEHVAPLSLEVSQDPAFIAESVEIAFAKNGPYHPVTLLPSEPPAQTAPREAAESDEGQEADERLHYHSCPGCYKHDPCRMDCAVEPDMFDKINNRRFGATCRCDECGPEDEDDALYVIPRSQAAEHLSQADELRAEIDRLKSELALATKKRGVLPATAERDDHNTPPEILGVVCEFAEGRIALDPCWNPTSKTNPLIRLTKEDDGLGANWYGILTHYNEGELCDPGNPALVFINPPYDQETLEKVNEAAGAYAGEVLQVITLVPVKSDQDWYQLALSTDASAVCKISGRVRFWADGKQQSGAAFPCCLFYYGWRASRFCEVFSQLGACLDLAAARIGGAK